MSEKEKKDVQFYTELVVVTVVALVTANVWIDFLQQTIQRFYPHNLTVLFISASILTVAAVFLLHQLFGKRKNKNDAIHPWSVKDQYQAEES